MTRNVKLLLAVGAVLAIAGGGVAIASSKSSPSEESRAVVNDAARQLGIPPSRLGAALKRALANRVDAAVAAGRITKAEGDALKERINADDFPLFRGFHRGFGHFFGAKVGAAAAYLGLTREQLRDELQGGKTLAQVAQAHGKSVDGLVDALVAEAKKHVDRAVASGRLTQAQASDLLDGLRARIADLVSSRGLGEHHFRR
ncbi:MAG: hypothetical protein ACJ74X_06825 [Gaiellaceae bacterium]